jgi:hypothetical protein
MKSTIASSNERRSSGADSRIKFARCWRSGYLLSGLFVVTGLFLGCERHTKLSLKGSNPPKFVMTGSGTLSSIRIGGPEKQRESEGEEAYLYWVIEAKKDEDRPIERLSPLAYGEVPDGYEQRYPAHGHPPPLIEGERYLVHIETFDANPFSGYMIIQNGKAILESN